MLLAISISECFREQSHPFLPCSLKKQLVWIIRSFFFFYNNLSEIPNARDCTSAHTTSAIHWMTEYDTLFTNEYYIYFCPVKPKSKKNLSVVTLQWQPNTSTEAVSKKYYLQRVSLSVKKKLVQSLGMVSSQCLHEKSTRFCKAGNRRTF